MNLRLVSLYQMEPFLRSFQINVFKSLNETAEDLYRQCKILKFKFNLVSLENCLFMYGLEHNKELAKMFAGITYISEKHKCNI